MIDLSHIKDKASRFTCLTLSTITYQHVH